MARKVQRRIRAPDINFSIPTVPVLPDTEDMEPLRREVRRETPWSPEEVQALLDGVRAFGNKSWKTILITYKDVFGEGRRVVDLVNKFRLYNKDSSFYRTAKRNWIALDEAGEPEVDSLGETPMACCKFPYDAAKKLAKSRIASGECDFVIRVRDAADIFNVKVYEVHVDDARKVKMNRLVHRKNG